MPKLVWLYLTALLYYRTSATCVAFAEALQTVSHDRLTRMLQRDWSGHTLLEVVCRTLFVWERGYLMIDDTVLPKPFATAMESLAWVSSSQEHKPVYGLSLVLLVWTNGILPHPARHPPLAQRGSLKVCLGLGVTELCPQSPALSPRLRPLRRLVSVESPAEAHSRLWLVLCLPPEEEPPLQWARRPGLSAPSLLGRHRPAHRGVKSLGRQIRRQVLCHQPPDIVGCRGAPALSRPGADRRSDQSV